jgi:hypothetical protein
MKKRIIFTLFVMSCSFLGFAQIDEQRHGVRFEQLGTKLRTPNVYRNASGAPGHMYWQQQADYDIEVTLNDDNQSITGKATINYSNNSPDALDYLWVQLDQNQRAKDSETPKMSTNSIEPQMSLRQLQGILWHDQDLGYKIISVTTAAGKDIPVTINRTMMRLDLAEPLLSG